MGTIGDRLKKLGPHWPAAAAVLLGIVLRALLSRYMFLQADEEIFSYDAYYFILGRSLDLIVGKIGAYLLYPMALAGWFKLFGVSLFGARLLTVLCWGIIMAVTYLILLKLTKQRRWAFLGTLLLAVLPYPLRYGHVVLSEPFAWTFITVSLYFLLDGMERDRWWALLLSGALIAVAFFARRSALILPIFLVPALIWVNRTKLSKGIKHALTYTAGFLLPFAAGLFIFISLFGWDRLMELGFLRIPNFTQDWALDLSTASTFDSALYALQPTVWKALPLLVPLLAGCLVMLSSLQRSVWKGLFCACFLWPALVRMAFDGHLNPTELFLVSVLPLVPTVPIISRSDPQRSGISLALLFGSAAAFSVTTLSLDIWNVILYSSVGAILLVHLDDRLDSQLGSFVMMGAGFFLLTMICFREPQLNTLFGTFAPLAGAVFFLTLPRADDPDVPMVLKVTGLVLLQLIVGLPDLTGIYLPFVLILPLLAFIAVGNRGKRAWKVLRYPSALGALAFLPLFRDIAFWPILAMSILAVVSVHAAPLLQAGKWPGKVLSAASASGAFVIVLVATGSWVLSGVALVLCGSASLLPPSLKGLSVAWKHRVGDKASVVLFLMVVAYIAFYIYYAWTEVYLMELIVPAVIIAALLLSIIFGPGIRVLGANKGEKGRSRGSFLLDRKLGVIMAVLLVASVPISVGAFLQDDWFREEPMDQRPYMRTIMEIADWIEGNTDKDDKVLAWHCYAVQADRETIIDVSNAAKYDGRKVMEDMERYNVTVFVRCYYTDHGLWKDQPYFQEYILENFRLDRTVDGNECYLRGGRS